MSGANIKRLFKLQKRATHIILKADIMTPSSYMFKQLSWLPIPNQLMYNKTVFTYKALNNFTQAYISYLLRPISKTHSGSLRSTDNGLFSIPRSRSAIFDRSFFHSAAKLWNTLPKNTRTAGSLSEFKVSSVTTFDFHYPLIIKLYSTVIQTNMQVF